MDTRQRTEVHIELEARAGAWSIGDDYEPLNGLMYNGRVPGPAIEARVGDTLVVRVTNRLGEPTTFDCGGSVLENGGDRECLVSPDAIEERRFVLTTAGTFRYGPLENDAQIERGLHGMLIVRGHDDPVSAAERTLVFDDLRLGRDRRIAVSSRCASGGREGNVLLLNGRVQPTLTMAPGTVERWKLLNVAAVRRVRFSLGGARLRIIDPLRGEPAASATDFLLMPGTGAEVQVGPFEAGDIMYVQALSYDRTGRGSRLPAVFATIHIERRS